MRGDADDKPMNCPTCDQPTIWRSTVSGRLIRTCSCYADARRARLRKAREQKNAELKQAANMGYDGDNQ